MSAEEDTSFGFHPNWEEREVCFCHTFIDDLPCKNKEACAFNFKYQKATYERDKMKKDLESSKKLLDDFYKKEYDMTLRIKELENKVDILNMPNRQRWAEKLQSDLMKEKWGRWNI